MHGTIQVRKIGGSLGIIIPQFIAQELHIKAGTLLNMGITDTEIILKLKYPERKTLLDYVNEVIDRGITEDLEV